MAKISILGDDIKVGQEVCFIDELFKLETGVVTGMNNDPDRPIVISYVSRKDGFKYHSARTPDGVCQLY